MMQSWALMTCAAAVAASARLTGVTLDILSTSASGAFAFRAGSETYYSPSTPVLEHCPSQQDTPYESQWLPLTVLKTNSTVITNTTLTAVAQRYDSTDDVWTPAFLGGAIAILAPDGASLSPSAITWLGSTGAQYILSTPAMDVQGLEQSGILVLQSTAWAALRPGPYTMRVNGTGVSIREAYLVYRDQYEAFLFGTVPVPGSSCYEPVDQLIPSYQDVWIPVPSRLYSLDDNRALAGMRIALKDIYDLEGVQTGGGSRSYAEVMPIANATAVSVKKLTDMGAVIVGKTKTSQFAHGADPWEFLDIHYPFSPRGDGWLTAASSSAGSAVAIAAYDWIDMALGSDTRGSVRKPAAMVGNYGIRPTWQSQDLTGVIPLATELDTAGFFVRDPELLHKVSKLWYQGSSVPVNKSFTTFPKKLLYPLDYFPLANPAAQSLFDDFTATLSTIFGMHKTPINISQALRSSPSPQISNSTAFQLSSNLLAEYISYHAVGLPVETAWRAKFPERGYPPFDPNPRAAFARSFNRTPGQYADAVRTKNEFRDLFLSRVLRPSDETCSEGVLILDIGTGGLPSYREQALNGRPGATSLTQTMVPAGGGGGQNVLANNYLASTAGCPEVGLPIGQVGYMSYVSLQMEVMPVSVDLVAYPGCDGMLLEMVRQLGERGVLKTVKTGRTAF